MKKALVGILALGVVFAFAGISVAAEEGAAKELKGDAGCAMCAFKTAEKCAPAAKVGDTVYSLKASEKASDATKTLIASFKSCAKAVPVVIQGTIAEKTIIVDSMTKVEPKTDM